jgi:hypothetical protein
MGRQATTGAFWPSGGGPKFATKCTKTKFDLLQIVQNGPLAQAACDVFISAAV